MLRQGELVCCRAYPCFQGCDGLLVALPHHQIQRVLFVNLLQVLQMCYKGVTRVLRHQITFNQCYVISCYVMLCYVVLCYVVLCYVALGYVMFCYVSE
jgi:hypothetical protein